MWPVLPFAGLELLGLGAAVAVSMRRGRLRECIQIDDRDVVVTRAGGRRQEEYRFARAWTRVRLEASRLPSWPSRLVLGCMGRAVEVGSFLTEPERQSLGRRLQQLIRAPLAGPTEKRKCCSVRVDRT